MNSNHINILANSIPQNEEPTAQVILDYIASFAHLTEAEQQAILDGVTIKTFKKGEFILMEGDILHMCYFILKGCVREYYIKDGEEKTTNFYIEQDPISPMTGNAQKTPSKYFLECLEDTIVSSSSVEQEEEMFKKFPKFESLCRVKVEEMFGEHQQRFANYMTSTPTERYLHLRETKPELLDRVPQYQLASFIGVKPETLSRIRKKISKNQKSSS